MHTKISRAQRGAHSRPLDMHRLNFGTTMSALEVVRRYHTSVVGTSRRYVSSVRLVGTSISARIRAHRYSSSHINLHICLRIATTVGIAIILIAVGAFISRAFVGRRKLVVDVVSLRVIWRSVAFDAHASNELLLYLSCRRIFSIWHR
jgi:hypothetical protein